MTNRWMGHIGLTILLWLGNAAAAGSILPGLGTPIHDGVVEGPPNGDLTDERFLGQYDWPALRFVAGAPLDWRASGALALPIENPAGTPFRLLIRIDDRSDANGDDRSLTGTIDLPPHAKGVVVLPLDAGPIGMVARPPSRAVPRPGEYPVMQVRGSIDLTHVTALHISGVRTPDDRTLRLGTATLRPAVPWRQGPIADAFGQAIDGHWPEKVVDIADLQSKTRQAQADTVRIGLSRQPLADRYGGIDPQTKLPATGYFRVERIAGRWSLVTPAGHRFFSLGVDAVAPSNPTIVEGRRGLFAAPPSGGRLDVGVSNIEIALGSDWMAAWRRQTLERLKAWNFNTLGNWSAPEVTTTASLPFVAFDDVEGESAKVEMPGGRALSDPFDPRFAGVADAVAQAMTATHRGDPFLLGYFSGNELPWGSDERPESGIAAQLFGYGPDSPAKQALVEGFRQRYGTVAAFSAAWGMPQMASWDDLRKTPLPWPKTLTPAAHRDMADFQRAFAMLYFRTVAQAIRRHDPHHLYLGTRFADAPSEIVEACARWCDVMSFNVYGASPEDRAPAWRRLDRPVLIGEFHFGSTDRGSFWPGMVDVGSEAARSSAYAAYLGDAVKDPAIVGCHWFQYADEPLTGRPYDGENGHIGLVAVTDLPFQGFVADVAAANRRTLEEFSARSLPALRGSL